tara:strand:- start:775 stop:1101 length:327 start_codon:yes stop_codon:yes gene_type:complete
MSKQLKPFERIWTDEEEIVLKANYLKYTQRELHEKFLPDKTPVQICQKKMDMKLFKPVWTNKERGLLIDHGADYTHKELVAKFFPNKSPSQVHGMRKYLGIKRHQKVE